MGRGDGGVWLDSVGGVVFTWLSHTGGRWSREWAFFALCAELKIGFETTRSPIFTPRRSRNTDCLGNNLVGGVDKPCWANRIIVALSQQLLLHQIDVTVWV